MSKFLQAAIKNEDITIYGDGLQTRTFCYIDDNLDACLNTFFDDKYKNDVYNIGNDQVITILNLAQTIIRITGSKSKIIHLPALKEGDMTKRQPDVTRMKELLGREMLPYEDGIRRILEKWNS
jgi:UDP-glucose 4-epimerase